MIDDISVVVMIAGCFQVVNVCAEADCDMSTTGWTDVIHHRVRQRNTNTGVEMSTKAL